MTDTPTIEVFAVALRDTEADSVLSIKEAIDLGICEAMGLPRELIESAPAPQPDPTEFLVPGAAKEQEELVFRERAAGRQMPRPFFVKPRERYVGGRMYKRREKRSR